MLIHADKFAFLMPPGFRDITGYTFRTGTDAEKLEVSYEEADEDETEVRTAMAALRARMEILFAGALTTESEVPVTLDGHTARQWIFDSQGENMEARRGQAALAEVQPGFHLKVLYTSVAAVTDAEDKFSIMTQSLTISESPKAGTAPSGYVRRQTGIAWLDVPQALIPPQTYVFLSEDESVRIEVARHYDPLTSETQFARAGVNSVVTVERLPDLQNRPGLEVGSVRVIIEDREITGVSRRSAYQVPLRFADDTWAAIAGYASQDNAAQMEDAVNTLAASLRYPGEKHG